MFKIGVMDIETTGLKQEDGHRIIEFGYALIRTANGHDFEKIGSTLCRRINPKRPIDASAQAVHGITSAELLDKPVWEQFAPSVKRLIESVDLLVAHNIEFDAPFVLNELIRVGHDPSKLPEGFCTMLSGRAFRPYGEVPKLMDLCWAFGIEYDEEQAHNAGVDVDYTTQCLIEGIKRGVFAPPALMKYRERVAKAA